MKLRLFAALAAMAVMVGMMAVPASANPGGQAVVLFSGKAAVCAGNPSTTASSCTIAGAKDSPNGAGQGLYAPLVLGTAKRLGSWTFSSGGYVVGAVPACVAIGLKTPGVDSACGIGPVTGDLGPAAGIGAACGISHGWNGTGAGASSIFGAISLKNVGWIVSAGSMLPISGHYNGGGKKQGPLVGVVNAQGGAPCATKPGASTFDVVGVVVLL